MNQTGSISAYLSLLHTERKFLQTLFEQRNRRTSFEENSSTLSIQLSQDRIQRLIEANILIPSQSGPQLSISFIEFFESFLGMEQEIEFGSIETQISKLEKVLKLLQVNQDAEKMPLLVEEIQKCCERLRIVCAKPLPSLEKEISRIAWMEKNETERKLALESCRQKLSELELTFQSLSQLLHTHWILKDAPSLSLYTLVQDIRFLLPDQLAQIPKIRQTIYASLHNTQYHEPIFIKLQQIQYLRSQAELTEKTNLLHVLYEEKAIILNQRSSFNSRLALNTFEQADFTAITPSPKKGKKQPNRTKISPSLFEINSVELVEEQILLSTLDELMQAFSQKTETDLFTFIQSYITENAINVDAYQLFCQCILQFSSRLILTEDYEEYLSYRYPKVWLK